MVEDAGENYNLILPNRLIGESPVTATYDYRPRELQTATDDYRPRAFGGTALGYVRAVPLGTLFKWLALVIAHPVCQFAHTKQPARSPPPTRHQPSAGSHTLQFAGSLQFAPPYLAVACVPAKALTRGSFLYRANSGSFRYAMG